MLVLVLTVSVAIAWFFRESVASYEPVVSDKSVDCDKKSYGSVV